jgi:hypothetical protein
MFIAGGERLRSYVANNKHGIAVFLLFLTAVLLSKSVTLNTPYYWDEMGWARKAHWLSQQSLISSFPGFHSPTAFWGHPAGLFFTLAVLFKLFGESIWLSHLLIAGFSFIGVYFTYLLAAFLYGRLVGILSAAFLFTSSLYFAQSGMYLGDIPVTALGVASIYFALRKKYLPYLLCAVFMVLIKETAAAVVFSLLLYLFFAEPQKSRQLAGELLKYGVPLLVIGAFFIWQKIMTGHFCCIYSYKFELFNLSTEDIIRQARLISEWLFLLQYRFVFAFFLIANLILNRAWRSRKELLLFFSIFACSGYAFSFLYFLPRYLLPALPYLYIMGTWSIVELIKPLRWRIAMGTIIMALHIYSSFGAYWDGNYEGNMKYLDVVKIHQSMCRYIENNFPNARILTAFPNEVQLLHPYLGYVDAALKAIPLEQEMAMDKKDFDLILHSTPVDDSQKLLKEFAIRNNLNLIKRFEQGDIIAELYAK